MDVSHLNMALEEAISTRCSVHYFVPGPTINGAQGDKLSAKHKGLCPLNCSDATFTLINKSGKERVRKVFGVTKLADNGIDNMRMTRFRSPPDVKGTVSLLIEHADRGTDK